MLNENEYFTHGAGIHFRNAAKMILQGANEKFVAAETVKNLRNHIGKCGGPTGLASLSTEIGIIAVHDSLRFGIASIDELQHRVDSHHRAARIHDREPEAVYEVNAVQRHWSRHQDSPQVASSLHELMIDWCMEVVNSVLLDRVQPSLRQRATSVYHTGMGELRDEVRIRLEGSDADIAMDLVNNQAVRIRVQRVRPSTEQMLNTSVFEMGGEYR